VSENEPADAAARFSMEKSSPEVDEESRGPVTSNQKPSFILTSLLALQNTSSPPSSSITRRQTFQRRKIYLLDTFVSKKVVGNFPTLSPGRLPLMTLTKTLADFAIVGTPEKTERERVDGQNKNQSLTP
jgi:hypothetical protein